MNLFCLLAWSLNSIILLFCFQLFPLALNFQIILSICQNFTIFLLPWLKALRIKPQIFIFLFFRQYWLNTSVFVPRIQNNGYSFSVPIDGWQMYGICFYECTLIVWWFCSCVVEPGVVKRTPWNRVGGALGGGGYFEGGFLALGEKGEFVNFLLQGTYWGELVVLHLGVMGGWGKMKCFSFELGNNYIDLLEWLAWYQTNKLGLNWNPSTFFIKYFYIIFNILFFLSKII